MNERKELFLLILSLAGKLLTAEAFNEPSKKLQQCRKLQRICRQLIANLDSIKVERIYNKIIKRLNDIVSLFAESIMEGIFPISEPGILIIEEVDIGYHYAVALATLGPDAINNIHDDLAKIFEYTKKNK